MRTSVTAFCVIENGWRGPFLHQYFFHLPRKRDEIALPHYFTTIYAFNRRKRNPRGIRLRSQCIFCYEIGYNVAVTWLHSCRGTIRLAVTCVNVNRSRLAKCEFTGFNFAFSTDGEHRNFAPVGLSPWAMHFIII